MTSTALDLAPSSWEEPPGVAARGTLVVLTGRGESRAAYGRFGRRISADAYKVRVVEVDLDDLDATRAEVERLLADEHLPAPRVLVGTDSGATLAAALVDTLPVEAVVVAGLALGATGANEAADGSWDDELEARTACPAHRRVITEDDRFERGALTRSLPSELSFLGPASTVTTTKPVLVLHGSNDPITSADDAFAAFADSPAAHRHLVEGARHDVLNDVSHRSVAATVVLFLERLKLGPDLPVIVRSVP